MPVVWLVVVDLLLIAAGVGAFYFWLALLPQPYQVVANPTRPVHATAASVAGVPVTVMASGIAASATAVSPTDTPPTPVTSTFGATATSLVATRPMRTEMGLAAPRAQTPQGPAATPRPTATRQPVPGPTPLPAALRGASGQLGSGKFADKFTSGDIEQTATSYRSANLSVTLSKTQRKGVTYYVQDIYVRYIDNLRTAFARNTYGRAIAAWQIDIARANNAIGSINGDYYGTGNLRVVIRNGVLYHARPVGDVCALFSDGALRVYAARDFDAPQVMAAGAYQAWEFGPGLMTPDGKAIKAFDSGIAGSNPRTALGYFEPSHYAFVVVDGRQPGYSNGMTLAQLASLFEELGCRAAYNLDGGQTSAMTFGGQMVSRPYRGGRPTSDIIFVGE